MPAKKMTRPVLREAASRYGLSTGDLKLLASSEGGNTVYKYQRYDKEFVLKLITHSSKDKQLVKKSLESELNFINYLADNGVQTPRAVTSQQGDYVELVDLDGKSFLSVVAWEKAPGREITESDFEADLYVKIGKLTGKIHALTKQYRPGQDIHKRPEWSEDDYLDIDRLMPSTDTKLIEKSWELVNNLKSLPRDTNSYGLVQGDLQEHNLFITNGAITILDFENCIYCWFIFDYVASLEAVIGGKDFGKEMEALTIYFSENYWKGYKQENEIDLFYFQKVPEFFKLWELLLYNEFINEWDMANLTEQRKRLLSNYRTDIIDGVRFANVDFKRFYYV